LAHFDSSGYQFGSFGQALVAAVALADPDHRAALAVGFPGLVEAVTMYQSVPGGHDRLIAIARAGR
jgi:hypothetical protein